MNKKFETKLKHFLSPHLKMMDWVEREALKIEKEKEEEVRNYIWAIEAISNRSYIRDDEKGLLYKYCADKILECIPKADVFELSVEIHAAREDLPKDRDLEIVTLEELKDSLEDL